MNFKKFWIIIEPRTKTFSILPGLLGILFAQYYFQQINLLNSALFLLAAVIFDAMTSALNNVADFYKGTTNKYQTHINLVGKNEIDPRAGAIVVIVMLLISMGIGIYLTVKVGLLLLLIGMFCFAVGIFYTFGPLPLSRLPLGEVFSGITMGFLIPLLAIIVNVPQAQLMGLTIQKGQLLFSLQLQNFFAVVLVCLLPIFTIAAVELANNVADYHEDLGNNRYTIAMYFQKTTLLRVLAILEYSGYLAVLVAVIGKILPVSTLIVWLTLPWVIKFVNIFKKIQLKRGTFHYVIIVAVLEMAVLDLGLAFGIFLS